MVVVRVCYFDEVSWGLAGVAALWACGGYFWVGWGVLVGGFRVGFWYCVRVMWCEAWRGVWM